MPELTPGQRMMVEDGLPAELILSPAERKAGVKLTKPRDLKAPPKNEDPATRALRREIVITQDRRQKTMAKTLEELTAEMGAENRANEAKVPGYSLKQAYNEAVFLARWAKGNRIVRQSADATFWAAGKWMTKLTASQANSLVEHGFATLKGDPHAAGAVLIVPKPPKNHPAAEAAQQQETAMKTAKKAPAKTTAAKAPKATARKPAPKKAGKTPAAVENARTPAGARPDGLRAGSKQAVMLDMVLAPNGATEAEICKKLGWKKCRVTLKRVCEKVGATLVATKNDGTTVFTATLPPAKKAA